MISRVSGMSIAVSLLILCNGFFYVPNQIHGVDLTENVSCDHLIFSSLSTGIVANWSFSEGNGKYTNDTSGRNNQGTLMNFDQNSSWVNGLIGNGLSFDGIDDYVEIPDGVGFDNQDNLSVSAWIYPTAHMPSGCILSKRNAFILAPGPNNNKLSFYIYDDGWRATTWSDPVDLNQWTHVMGVYGNTDNIFKLYINGIEVASDNTDFGNIGNDEGNLYIGWDDGISGRNFKGIIDEVSIYNSTVNATEVGNYYNITWANHLKDHLFLENTLFPNGVVSETYDHEIRVIGGTGIYNWTVDKGEIPKGLILSQNGRITGRPVENGVYSFEIKVTDTNSSSTSRPFSMIIVDNKTELVGDWDFNYGEMYPGIDLSGYWNNATLENFDLNTDIIEGKLRTGIRLNGQDNYIQVPHSASLNTMQNLTVQVWAKASFIEPNIRTKSTDAIPISNVSALQMIGSSSEYPLNGDYYLTNNISAGNTYLWNNNQGFDPIGSTSAKFTGTFDGRGFVITRLFIDRPFEDYVGLFSHLDGAVIKNLGLEGIDITGKDQYIGTLAGRSSRSSIINTFATGEVKNIGDDWWGVFGLGGLVGVSDYCDFHKSYADVTVSFFAEDEGYGAGGLVGIAENGRIVDCYSKGSILAEKGSGVLMMWWSKIGGLVGYTRHMDILNSYAKGDVITDGYDYSGGLLGQAYFGSIINSYASGNVESLRNVGGLGGSIYSTTVNYCHAKGNLIGLSNCGGLVGYSGSSMISYSYATGYLTEVTGTSWDTGGLVGELYQSIISNCYSYNNWVSGDNRVGGLVGLRSDSNVINSYSFAYQIWGSSDVGGLIGLASGTGSVTNSFFYNGQTSSSPGGGIPKSSAQLQTESTYVGWDFNFHWSMGGPSGWGMLQRPWSLLANKGTDSYSMHLNKETSQLKVGIGTNYLNVSLSDVDQWHQYAMTYDGNIVSVYVDGNQEGTLTIGSVTIQNSYDMMFGGGESFFQGAIDELKVFNNSLSPDGIKSEYNNTLKSPIIVTIDRKTAFEDEEYFVDYNGFDYNNDSIKWVLSTNAEFLQMDRITGILNGTPNQSQIGSYWVNITAVDPLSISEPHNFTLNVLNTNDAPIITTINLETVQEDYEYSVDYNALDVDPGPDTLVWNLSTDADWLTIDPITGLLTGIPENGHVGRYSVLIEVDDGKVVDQSDFVLVVQNVNDDPIIETQDITTVIEDTFYEVDYDGFDVDPTGDTLIWSLSTNAEWLKLNGNILSGQSPTNEYGTFYWINITLSDGIGGLDWTNFTLEITPMNDGPVLNFEPEINATEDITYIQNLTAFDIDGKDSLTWRLLYGPDWLSITNDILSGIPRNEHVGYSWVSIEVLDDMGATARIMFRLNVRNTNDAPTWILTPTDQEITENDGIFLDALAKDIDMGDTITYDISSMPKVNKLFIEPDTGKISWPGASMGDYKLNITATDGEASIFSTFNIEVKALPEIEDPQENLTTMYTDTDGDKIPDWWEEFYGLDPNNSADSEEDPDNDNLTNFEEYIRKTNPLKSDLNTTTPANDDGTDTKSSSILSWIFVAIFGIMAIVLLYLFYREKNKSEDEKYEMKENDPKEDDEVDIEEDDTVNDSEDGSEETDISDDEISEKNKDIEEKTPNLENESKEVDGSKETGTKEQPAK